MLILSIFLPSTKTNINTPSVTKTLTYTFFRYVLFLHAYTFVVLEPHRDGQVIELCMHVPDRPEHSLHLSDSAEKLDK